MSLFHDIQHAFYVEQRGVTEQDVLVNLVSKYDIDESEFLKQFQLEETKQQLDALLDD